MMANCHYHEITDPPVGIVESQQTDQIGTVDGIKNPKTDQVSSTGGRGVAVRLLNLT